MKRKRLARVNILPWVSANQPSNNSAQKLRNAVKQDDASAFTKAGKLKSGQECAHKFIEKCFGVLTTLKTKILEILTKMQTLEDKRKRMHPTAKEGLHPIREGKTKIESNQKSAKLSVKRKIVK